MNIWNGKKEKTKLPMEIKDIYETEPNETIFLDTLITQEKEIQLFLLGGIKLTGKVVGSDDFTIMVKNKNHTVQMIYKHAISTISLIDEMDNKFNNSYSKKNERKIF